MNPWQALLDLLGGTLAFFYNIIPSFGISIIFLTLVVSLLLFPLTLKQTRSMRAMQEIQPEIKRLQKEHAGNREELNKAMMALYQERGVNPAAGCLPLLLQMPIWFALFRVLQIRTADDGSLIEGAIPTDSSLWQSLVEDRTNFLAMDLLRSPSDSISAGIVTALPYLVLILIVVATGYYQQYQTTRRRRNDGQEQPQQPQGMQTAMKIMPLFFGLISWTFPAGLVLYFATSNLFRVGQQAVILKLDDDQPEVGDEQDAAKPKGGGPPSSKTGPGDGGPPKSRPSPHASKKRKRRRRK